MSVPVSLTMAFLAAAFAAPAPSRPIRFSLTLAQAETMARAHSLELKAAGEQAAAADDQADAQFASLLPRVTLDGFYRYETVPQALPVTFNSLRSTQLGPTLTWTLWDEGALYKSWKAQKAGAESQEEQARLVQTQAILGARLAYFQVLLAAEQARLLAESVAVTTAQYEDITRRFDAGAASRIDVLESHQEDLQRRKEFLNAQAALGTALRELLQIIGRRGGYDLSRPVDARTGFSLPEGLPTPTLLVDVEPLSRVSPELAAAASGTWDRAHPQLLLFERQAESARLSAEGLSSAEYPRVQLQAQALYEYPTVTQHDYVTQKTVALTASIPLFEGWQTKKQIEQQGHLASAADRRRDLAAEQIERDWERTHIRLDSLAEQRAIDARRVSESQELAHLVYVSYKAGRSTYIDVQIANLTALQAKIQAAQTRAQILIQLATLAQLAGQG